jgi:4-hydroxy 2-oxovalerate aldolase
MLPAPTIVENTLRDGAYTIDFQFTAEQTSRLVSDLEAAGLTYIEVGHGLGLGASRRGLGVARETDEIYLAAARDAATTARVGSFYIPGIGAVEDIERARESGLDFIRIGANVNEIERAEASVRRAKELGLEVYCNLMKSYALPVEEFISYAVIPAAWGVDGIYIVDSAGCMTPTTVRRYVDALRERTSLRIGFHGHNNLALALANTLAAHEQGAELLDTCIRGMGRGAGNTQTEALVAVLQRDGYDLGLDLWALLRISREVVGPIMPAVQGLDDIEVVAGMAGFHNSFQPMFESVAAEYRVDLGRLIAAVCEVDVIAPPEELVREQAQRLQATA